MYISPILKAFTSMGQMQKAADLVNPSFFKWHLRSENNILFWEEWWRGQCSLKITFPRLYQVSELKYCTIRDFTEKWAQASNGGIPIWNRQVGIKIPNDIVTLDEIVSSITIGEGEDVLEWIPGKGPYSTKIECFVLNQTNDLNNQCWKEIWVSVLPPKISIFLWKLSQNILPTGLFLRNQLRMNISHVCRWSSSSDESVTHLFWQCEMAI